MPTVQLNGLKHYYDDEGSGDEVLVMLHGANGSAHSFEEHYPELSARFRVIAPDMRSMGRSEHVQSMPASAWVDDLKALLDHLGITQAHIYGSSLGSRVALRFAIEHPDYTRSVILTAPHTYLTHELNDNMNRYDDDGTKLPPQEQEARRWHHGDDWLEAHRNFFNIRNVPELQQYYNTRINKPQMEVVHGFTDLSEPFSKVKSRVLVVVSDNLAFGRGTYVHGIELKEEAPDQVTLVVVPSYNPKVRGVDSTEFRRLVIQFADALAKSESPAGARA